MPSIGQFNFTGWRGRMQPSNRVIDVLPASPGIDGSVATLGGWRADVVEIVATEDVPSLTLVIGRINGYRNLEGAAVAVVDPLGITWSQVFVLRAKSVYDLLITGGYRVTTTWSLLPQSAPPP